MNMIHKLWMDEGGFIFSAELVLIATILVIGSVVGLVSLRNHVVKELVGVGNAFGQIHKKDRGDDEPVGISVYAWPSGAPTEPQGAEGA